MGPRTLSRLPPFTTEPSSPVSLVVFPPHRRPEVRLKSPLYVSGSPTGGRPTLPRGSWPHPGRVVEVPGSTGDGTVGGGREGPPGSSTSTTQEWRTDRLLSRPVVFLTPERQFTVAVWDDPVPTRSGPRWVSERVASLPQRTQTFTDGPHRTDDRGRTGVTDEP